MNPETNNSPKDQVTQNQQSVQQNPPIHSIYPDPDKIKQDKAIGLQATNNLVPSENTIGNQQAPIDGLLAGWMGWCLFIAVGAFLFLFAREEGQMFGGKGLHDIWLLPAIGITAGLAAFNIWKRHISGKSYSLYFIVLSALYLTFDAIADTQYGGLNGNDIFFILLICGGQAAYIYFSKQVAKTLTN